VATFKDSSVPHRAPQEPKPETSGAADSPVRRAAKPPRARLRHVRRHFELFIEAVTDYAIFMLDPEGYVATWNRGAERMKGYRADEVVGKHLSVLYPPEDVERGLPAQLLKAAETEGRAESEGWRVRKDGSRFWAKASIAAVRDEGGSLEGFAKVTRDLTERKRVEEALKELSGNLVEAQDRERKRISLSLSDSTSPTLAALVSKLHLAKSRSELIDECVALAESLSREIRTASYLLYPPLLETDGLLLTLRGHLKGLARHKGIPIDMDFPTHMERLPPRLAAALYRVVQEFLESILRARGSSRAKARIAVQEGELTLEVSVDGRGLPREALEEARRGIGELGVTMTGMRERMVRLGGSLEIHSETSSTWITATVPVPTMRSSNGGVSPGQNG
jgi:PAS domain S-box-containing protein